MLVLRRAYLPDGSATIGELTLEGNHLCFTLERPWLNNQVSVSCIPKGDYRLTRRASPIVERTSGGEFVEGWEVSRVPGRTHIMIHPGNWAKDTEGCILVGERFSWHPEHGPMVTNSRDTFRRVMQALDGAPSWNIAIEQVCR